MTRINGAVTSRALDHHQAERPLWVCAACRGYWPCEPTRKLLEDVYAGDREGLTALMSWCMALAAKELGVANPIELYPRFVGWTFGREHGCRLCGKPRHDVLPGVPVRLTPCGAVREAGTA